ncbi:helix-turn-helix domain-containing protein [Phytobacter sp. V91]|uniref:helix-turn-helix domain-containing protein n=1 Tax=Phytobacter sp. V91 TaxID=3369425 RepID=UPI003F60C79D
MPSLPFPVFTLFILLILLARVCLQPGKKSRGVMYFIAGCALLVMMSALRWAFDAVILRQLQSLLAILFPPLVWRCFTDLTGQKRAWHILTSILPPVLALLINLARPDATDAVLVLLYLGYGIALLRTALLGADAFILTRLSDSPTTSMMAFAAGCFLCFSSLTDLAIAWDFSQYNGQHAPLLVAISQGILLPFICLAILFTGRKVTAPPLSVTVDACEPEIVAVAPEDQNLCQKLETTLAGRELFLDPDLSLNALARKTGIPARQISQAINRTRGCNVSQWINGFRIQHAQRLLLQSDVPITQVMLEAGFSTKSNFNREFARVSGMTPGDFRRAAADNSASDLKTDLSS